MTTTPEISVDGYALTIRPECGIGNNWHCLVVHDDKETGERVMEWTTTDELTEQTVKTYGLPGMMFRTWGRNSLDGLLANSILNMTPVVKEIIQKLEEEGHKADYEAIVYEEVYDVRKPYKFRGGDSYRWILIPEQLNPGLKERRVCWQNLRVTDCFETDRDM